MFRTNRLLPILTFVIMSLYFTYAYAYADNNSGMPHHSPFIHNTIRQKCIMLRHTGMERHRVLYGIHGVINSKAQVGGPVLVCSGPDDKFPRQYSNNFTMVYFVDYNSYVNTYNNAKEFKELLNASPTSFTIRLFRSFDSNIPDEVATSLEYYSRITGGMAELAFVPDIEPGLYVLVCKINYGAGRVEDIKPHDNLDANNFLLFVEGSILNDGPNAGQNESDSTKWEKSFNYTFGRIAMACITLMFLIIAIVFTSMYRIIILKRQKI